MTSLKSNLKRGDIAEIQRQCLNPQNGRQYSYVYIHQVLDGTYKNMFITNFVKNFIENRKKEPVCDIE